MKGTNQSPNPPPASETQLKTIYEIRPGSYPSGLKVEITDKNHQLVYILKHQLANPSRYYIYAPSRPEIPAFIIKSTQIGGIRRYTLYDNQHERNSLLHFSSTTDYLLRDDNRSVIARFHSITAEKILLRQENSTIAHIQKKPHPNPLGFILKCQIKTERSWLLAILLYLVPLIEKVISVPLSEPVSDERSEANVSKVH